MFNFIRALFKTTGRRGKKPRRRARFARLNVELLETRVTPVIGNTGLAPAVAPGTNMDGVVSLITGNSIAGSGSELSDQRMILTAAHLISTDLFQLTVAIAPGGAGAGYSVGQTFTMPQGVGLGEVDTGARPLSIRITAVAPGGGALPAGAITGFTVMDQQGNYVAGATGGLYVSPPPLSSALFVAGFNNNGSPNPAAVAAFTIASARIPGSGSGGGVGQVPVGTVNFNLQRNGNAVNISIPVPGLIGLVQPGAANPIAGPAAGTFNNMLTPAAGPMAWTTPAGAAGPNDIGLVVLRDPSPLPGVAAGQNLEMVAPFSPFENGYPTEAPPPPGGGANGQQFNVVGYGYQGIGDVGIVSASGIQQITVAPLAGGGGDFTLTFNRPAIPGFPAALLRAVPAGGFTTAPINVAVPPGPFGPANVAARIAAALNAVITDAYGDILQGDVIVTPDAANTYLVRFRGFLTNITVPPMNIAPGLLGLGAAPAPPVGYPLAAAPVTPAQPAIGALPTKSRALNTLDQTVPAAPAAGARMNGSIGFFPGGSINAAEYDFDNRLAAQNMMGGIGVALIANEGFGAPGDSGGPGLVGNFAAGAASPLSIVGVQSDAGENDLPFAAPPALPGTLFRAWIAGGGALNLQDNCEFGAYAVQTVANNYLASLVTPAQTAAYGAVLDMRYQVLGAATDAAGAVLPQDPLTITVGRGTAAGAFEANGPNLLIQVEDTAQPANFQYNDIYFNQPIMNGAVPLITSLFLRGNDGNDTFDIRGNLGVGPITVIGGGGANNKVEYLDGANGAVTTYTVTAAPAAGVVPANTRLTAGTQVVTAYNIQSLDVYGGTNKNTFDVQSTLQVTPVNIYTALGANADVIVGNPTRNLNNIAGNVSVNNRLLGNLLGGTVALTVNDQNGAPGTNYTNSTQNFLVKFGKITTSRPGGVPAIGTISYSASSVTLNEAVPAPGAALPDSCQYNNRARYRREHDHRLRNWAQRRQHPGNGNGHKHDH